MVEENKLLADLEYEYKFEKFKNNILTSMLVKKNLDKEYLDDIYEDKILNNFLDLTNNEELTVTNNFVENFIINSVKKDEKPIENGYVVTIDGLPKFYSLNLQKCLYLIEVLVDSYKNSYFNDYEIRVEFSNDKITVYKKHN